MGGEWEGEGEGGGNGVSHFRRSPPRWVPPPLSAAHTASLASYTLAELSDATDGFAEGRKVGGGGCGSVLLGGSWSLEDGVTGRSDEHVASRHQDSE